MTSVSLQNCASVWSLRAGNGVRPAWRPARSRSSG
eukprot:CAMPEP_0181219962 /NCGR_PEP_ID=MMETSP1096-20121128/28577_1 /TAXON_ID=156174 ORGANISM="Chrysochromulina ericina, Strain CCMP281" /NCGR_SAMPLE_ID=MMETSP1096 /ASSEMBLY_ACC=CAM_ASM_000453 /LENGTH=34 /DNA_ID= /DNA_START= /DNA_END= /DNA_ORIENTATION=